MKLFRAAALVTAALMCGATSALAAPGDAPAGWSLVGSETVRYFVPGTTPPAGADLANSAAAAQITSQNPGSGEWLLVGTDNVKDFLPDTVGGSGDQLLSSTFVSTRGESKDYYSGREKLSGEPKYDPAVWETDTKKWRLVSQTATVRRYDVPVYQGVHTPYKIVDRYGHDTRKVDTYDNTYQANKTVKTALGDEIVDTHTYTKREEKATAWARGPVEPSMDKLISEGIDDSTRTTVQAYVVDLLAGQVAQSDKAQGPKAAQFLSDSGSGNTKTSLSGSKKRVVFKADEAVASLSRNHDDDGGSILDPQAALANGKDKGGKGKDDDKGKGKGDDDKGQDTPPVAAPPAAAAAAAAPAAAKVAVAQADPRDALEGTWRLAGGSESYFTVKREGKENIKVDFVLKSQFGTFEKEFTFKYGPSWSVSHKGVTTTATVSSDQKKIVVTTKFLRRTISSTFVKQ